MNNRFSNICAIGLPTAALLATKGYTVHGIGASKKVVDVIDEW